MLRVLILTRPLKKNKIETEETYKMQIKKRDKLVSVIIFLTILEPIFIVGTYIFAVIIYNEF